MLNKVIDIVTIVILTVPTAIGGYIVLVVAYFAFTCKVLKEHKG